MGGQGRVHATGRLLFAEPVVLLDATERKPVPEFRWIHCANEGDYRGHHQGEFKLTRRVFESFVKNFRDDPQYKAGTLELSGGETYTGGVRPVLQFDYEHASEMPAFEGSIPATGAPACGWVLEVAIREGADGRAQLWVFAQLGEQIRGQIMRNEYRSVSIAFTLEATHWVSGDAIGPALTSVAFTNHPYMRDLEPLAAANRAASQPGRDAVKPTHDPSEAPGVSDQPRTGANMSDDQFRSRLCRALKIHKLASDEEVGAAVEEAASAAGNLKSLLESLGVKNPDEAMKTIPELRAAREKLAGLLSELDSLLQQETAIDAEVAKDDVAAAMKAANYQGSGAERALTAYRAHLVAEEVAKLGDEPKLSQLRDARRAGSAKFRTEYGVKEEAHDHLSKPVVATRGGTQLQPPKVLPITERGGDDQPQGEAIDLRGLKGNTTERLIAHLRKTETGFDKLPWDRQVARAAQVRRTAQLTLE